MLKVIVTITVRSICSVNSRSIVVLTVIVKITGKITGANSYCDNNGEIYMYC